MGWGELLGFFLFPCLEAETGRREGGPGTAAGTRGAAGGIRRQDPPPAPHPSGPSQHAFAEG